MEGREEEERERHGLVASRMCPDQGQGGNPKLRYVPLPGNRIRDPSGEWADAVTTEHTGLGAVAIFNDMLI